jgi:hypothetical protein
MLGVFRQNGRNLLVQDIVNIHNMGSHIKKSPSYKNF